MKERDIRGAVLAIVGALEENQALERTKVAGAEAYAKKQVRERELLELVVRQGVELGAQLLVDINRGADALERIAESLAKLAHPPIMNTGDAPGWPVRVKPGNPPGCG